jgi:cyanophycin synthetase
VRTQVDAVLEEGTAVLNAHDPLVVEMAELCIGKVVYFATDETLEAVTAHCARGGQAVVLSGRSVDLLDGSRREPLLELGATFADGRWRGTVAPESLLAAVAAAHGLGLPIERVRAGIYSYVPVLTRIVTSNGRRREGASRAVNEIPAS